MPHWRDKHQIGVRVGHNSAPICTPTDGNRIAGGSIRPPRLPDISDTLAPFCPQSTQQGQLSRNNSTSGSGYVILAYQSEGFTAIAAHYCRRLPGVAESRYCENRFPYQFARDRIQKQDPSFFTMQKPFIGYLDFLWEKQIRSRESVKQLRIDVSYGRAGKMAVPEGDVENGYWRFKSSNYRPN